MLSAATNNVINVDYIYVVADNFFYEITYCDVAGDIISFEVMADFLVVDKDKLLQD
jgi:hypothetical protein